MKKIVSMLVVLSMFLLILPSVGASQASIDEINTPEEYIQWLQSGEGFSLNASDNNKMVQEFKALTPEQQEKFVQYVTDPEVTLEIYKAMKGNKETELYNGDIKVIVEKEDDKFSLNAKTYTAAFNAKSVIFGLTIVHARVFVEYTVSIPSWDNRKVTEIHNGGGIVLKNYQPTVQITVKDNKPYIANNAAHQTSFFSWNIIHKQFGIVACTDEFRVHGFADGSSDYELYKNY